MAREERAAQRRAQLLDVFIEVVGRSGYHRARITQVCQAAGMSNRAFYAMFADKDACFVAAYEDRAWLLTNRAKAVYQGAPGLWEDRVQASLGVVMSYLAEHPAYARFSVIEAMSVGPAAARELNAVVGRCQRAFGTDELRQGAPPELRRLPLGSMMTGAVMHPVYAYVKGGKTERLPELVPALVYFLTLMVFGPDRAARVRERAT